MNIEDLSNIDNNTRSSEEVLPIECKGGRTFPKHKMSDETNAKK